MHRNVFPKPAVPRQCAGMHVDASRILNLNLGPEGACAGRDRRSVTLSSGGEPYDSGCCRPAECAVYWIGTSDLTGPGVVAVEPSVKPHAGRECHWHWGHFHLPIRCALPGVICTRRSQYQSSACHRQLPRYLHGDKDYDRAYALSRHINTRRGHI